MIKYEKKLKEQILDIVMNENGVSMFETCAELYNLVKPLLSRQIEADNKRFREMIGEDEEHHSHEDEITRLSIDDRNELRQELRQSLNKKEDVSK